MNHEQALNVLALATEPANIAKLSRADYVNIHQALVVLDAMAKELAELKKPKNEPVA